MVQKQTIPFSFQGGLNSKTDALQVQPPNLLELQNARFDKVGQLNKRPGYDILPSQVLSGNNIASAAAIDTFNSELNLFDNQNLYSYTSTVRAWSNRGPAISLINTNNQIVRSAAAQQLNPDGISVGGITVFTWEDSRGGCRYSVLDSATNSYVQADQVLQGSRFKTKTIVFNGLIYLLYIDTNNLYYRTISPSNPQVISQQTNLIADGITSADNPNVVNNFNFDCCVTANGRLFVAYFSSDFGVRFFFLNTSNTISTIFNVSSPAEHLPPPTTFPAINIVEDSQSQLWISFSSGHDVKLACYLNAGSTPPPILNTIIVDGTRPNYITCSTLAGIEYVNPGVLQLVYEVANANGNPSDSYSKTITVTNSGVVTQVGIIRSVGLATKPFFWNGNNFIHVSHQSALQSTYFMTLLTRMPFTIVSKVASGEGGGLRTNGMLPEINQTSPGAFLWSNLIKGTFISEDNTNFSLLGVNSTISDFTNANKFNSTTSSNNLLFVGGILQSYDGISVAEQNFHIYPEGITAAQLAGEGSLSAGQYQYQVIYAWCDRLGQFQYSSPSIALTYTASANDAVALSIPTCRLTAKTNVVIKVYRTQVNSTVFQEVTSELAPLLNNGSVDYVIFVDTAADIAIAANQTIYTTGGVLPNSAPPSCSLISLYQDRVILGGLEDRNLLWFSKNKSNNTNFNTIPAEFSDALTIGISNVGGPITALGLMDQNLIIFKESAIFILSGDGPNDEGGGDAFPDAQLVTQQVGCTNSNSIIFTGQGLMFQTPSKGIWLLDRNLSPPEYIGAGVDDFALQYTVSSATLDQTSNSVIFTTYNGPALVYDYLIQQWSTFTNHQAVDSVNFQGLFTFCKPNGSVYQQNPDIFYDGYVAGTQVPYSMEFVTPWISAAQPLGYQNIYRVFVLGQYRGPHTLNAAVGYNFNPAFTSFAAINVASTAGSNTWGSDPTWGASTPWGGTWQPYMYQINCFKRCTSFRIKISDSQTQPYNEGFTANSLLLELGLFNNGNRGPATNKLGAQ